MCSQRASAAVLSHEHRFVPCADGDPSCGDFACARAVVALMFYLNMSPRKVLCAAGIPRAWVAVAPTRD